MTGPPKSASPVRGRQIADQEKLKPGSSSTLEARESNASPSQKTAMPRWRRKWKDRSTIERACTWIVDHQISISAYLLSVLFVNHFCFPVIRHHTQKFFRISYYNPRTGTFALGWDDMFFVFYWIIVFTGMRCVVMDYILTPIATWAGIEKKKARIRFAEQAWILIYDTGFWSTGMYLMSHSPYWFNLRELWRNWPVREMSGLAKWYYLVQFAFWLQQIAVVNIEERRKDHWQMFTHHIITCALIFTSYGYHQTRVGNLILCLMDVVDLFLPLAKILKYLKFTLACDITFGVFMVTWFVARHALYMTVCWSIYAHIPQEINYGCYKGSVENLQGPFPVPNDYDHLTQPFRDPVGLVCWNNNIKWAFLCGLLALQCVLLVWFVMIIKVAYKVISGQGAEDMRSDDEDDEEEEDTMEIEYEKIDGSTIQPPSHAQTYIEKEILSTDAEFSGRTFNPTSAPTFQPPEPQSSSKPLSLVRRSSRRRNEASTGAHSSSVNLLAHSGDRKELLGRIGCDKSS